MVPEWAATATAEGERRRKKESQRERETAGQEEKGQRPGLEVTRLWEPQGSDPHPLPSPHTHTQPPPPDSPMHPRPPVDGGHLGGPTRGELEGRGLEWKSVWWGAEGARAPPPQVNLLKKTFKVDVQQPIRG